MDGIWIGFYDFGCLIVSFPYGAGRGGSLYA